MHRLLKRYGAYEQGQDEVLQLPRDIISNVAVSTITVRKPCYFFALVVEQ